MVWVGRDFKDYFIPILPWAGTYSTRPGCSKPHPTWPWTLPGRGAVTASLGNLCQCLTTLMVKNFFLISHLNLPSFSLELFPLATTHPCEKPLSILPVGPLQVLEGKSSNTKRKLCVCCYWAQKFSFIPHPTSLSWLAQKIVIISLQLCSIFWPVCHGKMNPNSAFFVLVGRITGRNYLQTMEQVWNYIVMLLSGGKNFKAVYSIWRNVALLNM